MKSFLLSAFHSFLTAFNSFLSAFHSSSLCLPFINSCLPFIFPSVLISRFCLSFLLSAFHSFMSVFHSFLFAFHSYLSAFHLFLSAFHSFLSAFPSFLANFILSCPPFIHSCLSSPPRLIRQLNTACHLLTHCFMDVVLCSWFHHTKVLIERQLDWHILLFRPFRLSVVQNADINVFRETYNYYSVNRLSIDWII